MYTVRPNWHNFGLALEVDPIELKSIETKYRQDPSDCLREMLYSRLKLQHKLTWRDIINALRKQDVGENKLADQLEDAHKELGAEGEKTMSEVSRHVFN